MTGTEEWEIRYCPALGVFVRTLEIWLPSVFRSTASVKGVSAPYEAHRSCRYCPRVDSLHSLVPCLPFGSMEWHASLLSHLPSSFFHFNRYRPEETSGQALPTEVRKRKKKCCPHASRLQVHACEVTANCSHEANCRSYPDVMLKEGTLGMNFSEWRARSCGGHYRFPFFVPGEKRARSCVQPCNCGALSFITNTRALPERKQRKDECFGFQRPRTYKRNVSIHLRSDAKGLPCDHYYYYIFFRALDGACALVHNTKGGPPRRRKHSIKIADCRDVAGTSRIATCRSPS